MHLRPEQLDDIEYETGPLFHGGLHNFSVRYLLKMRFIIALWMLLVLHWTSPVQCEAVLLNGQLCVSAAV